MGFEHLGRPGSIFWSAYFFSLDIFEKVTSGEPNAPWKHPPIVEHFRFRLINRNTMSLKVRFRYFFFDRLLISFAVSSSNIKFPIEHKHESEHQHRLAFESFVVPHFYNFFGFMADVLVSRLSLRIFRGIGLDHVRPRND